MREGDGTEWDLHCRPRPCSRALQGGDRAHDAVQDERDPFLLPRRGWTRQGPELAVMWQDEDNRWAARCWATMSIAPTTCPDSPAGCLVWPWFRALGSTSSVSMRVTPERGDDRQIRLDSEKKRRRSGLSQSRQDKCLALTRCLHAALAHSKPNLGLSPKSDCNSLQEAKIWRNRVTRRKKCTLIQFFQNAYLIVTQIRPTDESSPRSNTHLKSCLHRP